MRVVRTSKLSTNPASIHYKVARRTLGEYLVEISKVNLNWGGKRYLCHSGRKSYPRKLLGQLKLGAP
jgi:hypothetical protein